jgi:hypothetical protein
VCKRPPYIFYVLILLSLSVFICGIFIIMFPGHIIEIEYSFLSAIGIKSADYDIHEDGIFMMIIRGIIICCTTLGAAAILVYTIIKNKNHDTDR